MIQKQRFIRLLLLLVALTAGAAVVDASREFNSQQRKNQSKTDIKVVAPQLATAVRALPPSPPVIFLHYDYMAAPSWDLTRGDFAPDPAAIERVVEAFRHHGITLVIDPEHTEIPYVQYMSLGPAGDPFQTGFECPPTVCANFYDLKSQYFSPKGTRPWHYVIFGDRGYTPNGFVAGQAELAGYNFMVTISFPHRTCFFGTLDFCQNRMAGTFMHELGHNLDLRHGGDEEQNYKLNYLSVMNYQYQNIGIPYTAPGDTYQFSTSYFVSPPLADVQHIAGFRLDYSEAVLPTVDEWHVDERLGIGGPAGSTDLAFYYACVADLSHPCQAGLLRAAAASFDWDNNGVIEPDVAADINYIPNLSGDLLLTTMSGFDDWTHVQAFLRTPRYVTGTLRPIETIGDPLPPSQGLLLRP